MALDPTYKPKLRPVEAFALPDEKDVVGVRDRDGMTGMMLTVSGPALKLLSYMDGAHTIEEIRNDFFATYGQPVKLETIESMVVNLEQSCFLEGAPFDALHAKRTAEYRAKSARPAMHCPYDREQLLRLIDAALNEVNSQTQPAIEPSGIRGIIAPHLDFARGAPCYGAAYRALRGRPSPKRVVILGTNHCGRGGEVVVATGIDFQTPLGTTRCDKEFLKRVEDECGDLRRFELDHAHEHSIELQVVWLQQLFGPESFSIVPFLCPDPSCRESDSPGRADQVSLSRFADALSSCIAADRVDTLVIAGADLSHVGASFGDERALERDFLQEVRVRDQQALDLLAIGDADAFAAQVAKGGNPTRVCSAGCIFTIAKVMAPSKGRLLHYHQAVDQSEHTCVTCTAVIYS